MPNHPPRRRSSVRHLILAVLITVSLIVPLTPLGRLFPASFVPTASAAPFASGNVVVYRVGDGSAALGSAATAVFLDEYTPAGVLVQSIPMPTTASGANKRLTASGTATSEGLMTRSTDGKYLILTGYDAALATAGITGAANPGLSRVVGRVDGSGNVDTSTALTDTFSAGNPRSATSTNGTDLWVTGSNSGVRYATLGATTSTQVSSTLTNLRQVSIFDNQLYISTQSGSAIRIAPVGTGTPTTSGQTMTNLPSFPTTGSPYGFFFADLSAAVPGVDTLYVADDGVNGTTATTGIKKYSLSGGTWNLNGSLTATAMRGLTGSASGNTVTLYATAGTGSSLHAYTDTSGYNAAPNGTLTTIVSAGTNKAFRGVALAPQGPPVSTNPSASGTAAPNSVKAGNSALLTVNITPGSNPTSVSYTVKGDLSSIGGSPTQDFNLQTIDANGNAVYTFNATVSANTTPGNKSITVSVKDDQNRSAANASIALNVQAESLSHVVISQVYGGGGNNGATIKNDFIELYNPTANTVSLNGWSVQYASSSGSTWQVTDLTGSIAPGKYYLIQEAQGAGGTQDLPTPNATGSIPMGATAGKVALVNNSDTMSGSCPDDPNLVDFVGYGSANCYEGFGSSGIGPAPATTNTTAIFRIDDGNTDTDRNSFDFTTGDPNPRNGVGGGGGGSELAPFVSSTSPGKNASNVLVNANITVNFSEAVNVTGAWYTINCANSLAHTATVSGGPASFTINPTTDFANSEQCTVTISAAQVTDQDSSDPPDNMTANYVFSFTTVSSSGVVRDPNEHMVMGNPSGALPVPDAANENNYLMMKPEFALSYNRSRAIPNWTSWHLDSSWRGSQPRTDAFRADPDLPSDWYHVNETSYSGSGFDRGHMTPSADRTFSYQENAATFVMTNMVPQAPDNNQVTWEGLESYARTLLSTNEVYIISGGWGQGGIGRNGPAQTVDQGRVVVPAKTWKVLLILPNGDNDVSRVNTSTRTIGVIMPNEQGINADWHNFIVSVDEVEALTGYDFFSNVPVDIQAVIEANADGNTRPTANAQSVSVAEDGSKSITLTASDAENNQLTYEIADQPTHGTLNGSGTSYTYTPAADYNGPDSFSFTVKDKYLTSTPATVSISVTEVNDPVETTADSKSTNEDTPLLFQASDLTANDSAGPNEGSQTLTVTAVISTPDTHGTVNLNAGQITYTPASDYNGPASFDYTVCDDGTTSGVAAPQCGTGTVNVTVNSTNDAPVAANDSYVTNEDTALNVPATGVLSNDQDNDSSSLSALLVSGPSHGSLTLNSDGSFSYTPAANYNGPDSFTYKSNDGTSDSNVATVSITVNPVNDAPTAASDSYSVNEDGTLNVNTATGVLSNDQDIDSATITAVVASGPSHGSLTLNSDGSFAYTPAANYNGPDSFTYNASDGSLSSGAATVSINVASVNDAPVLSNVPASFVINNLTPYSFTATATDVDVPSTLTFSLVGAPAGATINPSTGQFNWTPTVQQLGAIYTFKVRVSDGQLTDEKQITIAVAHSWSGVLSPINADGTSIFKIGRTIPVKFKLTGVSAGVTNAVVKLSLFKISNGIVGSEIEAESTAASTTGNLFRYDASADQYIFNLNTSGLTAGTYQLQIDTGDGVPRLVFISLSK